MTDVCEYVSERCSVIIETYKKVMTEYGLITESDIGEDVDGFYQKLSQAIVGKVMFEEIQSVKKWHGLHRKKFKVFLVANQELLKLIYSEVKPRGYALKNLYAEPPNRLQKIIENCENITRKNLEKFSYNPRVSEPKLETILG